MRRAGYILAASVAAALGGCSGGGSSAPDADPIDGGVDAEVDASYPACVEFGAPSITISELPLSYEGSLEGAGADIEAPAGCQLVDAPFGMATPGADTVVELAGLTIGVEYVVRLTGGDDLAFYVASGCSTATGPSGGADGDCKLFVDATVEPVEVGTFVADAETAYVIVDYWEQGYPAATDFRLEVYPSECAVDAECGDATPVCLDGRCVACDSDFDCTDPARPLCDEATSACVAGTSGCTGDDAAENGDDGPAGAAPLVPGQVAQAAICNNPPSEADFYRFVVAENGEHWTITLAWTAAVDLDLVVFDSQGRRLGMSFYEEPERIALTYLPAGEYFVGVDYFASTQTSLATPYGISATRQVGDECTATADCAAEYRNQVFRGECVTGACRSIEGLGLRQPGERCDSDSDCVPSANCSSFFFVADADERMVCGTFCEQDADCAGLGGDFVCTTYLTNNFCVARCASDEQCPTAPFQTPTTPPWLRFQCQLSTGRCLPP